MMNVKDDYLEQVDTGWKELNKVLAQCTEEQMEQPGASGYWSPKDVMAHITWFEKEMIVVLEKRTLIGSDWWNNPTDERNRLIYEENKNRPLEEIRSEFIQVHADLLALLKYVTNEELTSPSKFKDMPPDWIPVDMLAGNTSGHYHEHAQWLQDWLESLQKDK